MYLVNSGVYDDDIMMMLLSSEPKKFMDKINTTIMTEELWRSYSIDDYLLPGVRTWLTVKVISTISRVYRKTLILKWSFQLTG